MPQADGEIIIDTELRADGMKAGSKEIEAAVRRMSDSINDYSVKAKTAIHRQVDAFVKLNQEYAAQEQKVERLKQKVSEYANQRIPTQEYREVQIQIEKATRDMNCLTEAQERFIASGGRRWSNTYRKQQYDIDQLANTIRYAEGELRELEATGRAFTFGTSTKAAAADMERLASEERKLANMNNKLRTSYGSIKGSVDKYKSTLQKTDSAQNKASNSSKRLSKSLKDTDKSARYARIGFGQMLKNSLLLGFAFQAIQATMRWIVSGFQNLAKESTGTNANISMLWSSLARLQNALASAFSPILSVVAPILSKFIDMLATAANYVSMFFSFLSGKNTYTKALSVQKDYAASLDKTSKSAKDTAKSTQDAADAAEAYLSPLDDINRLESKKDSSGNGGSSSGSGGGSGSSGPMFVEEAIGDTAKFEKFKDILDKIFEPFKKAWEREGKNTIDAAKYAFSSLGELAKSVGQSMLEVWTNGTGEKMLVTMLQIAQDLFKIIGNIATKLNEAWNKNEVGTRIIQNIANAVQAVLDWIKKIADDTERWSKNLDFYPLLEAIANLTSKLQPLIQAIGNTLEWLYKNIVLPLLKWCIENGLPELIDTIAQLFELITAVVNFINDKILPIIKPILDALLKMVEELTSGCLLSLNGFLTFLTGIFQGDISKVKDGIEKMIQASANNVSAIFKFIQNGILTPLTQFLKNIWTKDWSVSFGYLGNYLNGFLANVKNAMNSVRQTLNGIITFLQGVFTGNWSQAWQGIINTFKGLWSGIASAIKQPINNVISKINAMLSAVSTGVNKAIRMLNRIKVPSWVPGIGGKSVHISSVGTARIPYLAQGGVIPPNKEFMAVLGDQKSGNNIEAPESLIRKIVREESGNKGNTTYKVQAQVGRRTLFDLVLEEAKIRQTSMGTNPFELA